MKGWMVNRREPSSSGHQILSNLSALIFSSFPSQKNKSTSHTARRARTLRALGLFLADGAPTVGRGKTFWGVNRIFFTKTAVSRERKVGKSFPRWEMNGLSEGYKRAVDQNWGHMAKIWLWYYSHCALLSLCCCLFGLAFAKTCHGFSLVTSVFDCCNICQGFGQFKTSSSLNIPSSDNVFAQQANLLLHWVHGVVFVVHSHEKS